jgi:hypothetical protein
MGARAPAPRPEDCAAGLRSWTGTPLTRVPPSSPWALCALQSPALLASVCDFIQLDREPAVFTRRCGHVDDARVYGVKLHRA